jgi:hypothetical protein
MINQRDFVKIHTFKKVHNFSENCSTEELVILLNKQY